ncbi:hypothetical protein GCM10027589_04210 [Actinocorallia lasiicapitis]
MANVRVGAQRGRRQHGAGPRVDVEQSTRPPKQRGLIQTSARLDEEEYLKAHTAAKAAGISFAAFIGMLIRRCEVDENGRPLWADEAQAQLALTEAASEDAA